MGYGYEQGAYRLHELLLQKEDIVIPEKRQPSGYMHPEVAESLPEQSLLVNWYKEKKRGD
jgi:hypothetical protein